MRKVKLSDKQKITYFEWNGTTIKGKGREIPISWYKDKQTAYNCRKNKITKIEDLNQKIYHFGTLDKKGKIDAIRVITPIDSKKWILCNRKNDWSIPIICNEKKAGTPRFYLIKGQDIYSGNLREHMKGNIMNKIKESYLPFIKDILPIIDYPVKIECELHDTIKNFYDRSKNLGQRWDVDNYAYPYMKAFPDLLVEKRILFDDDRLHLTQPPNPIFYPIDNHEDRKLVFIISKDEREIIKNNEIYKTYHKNKETFETEDKDLCAYEDGSGIGSFREEVLTNIKDDGKPF